MQTHIQYEKEIMEELKNMPNEQILNLLNIIRIFKKSIIIQREVDFSIRKEFDEWDTLSDEALNNFEVTLF